MHGENFVANPIKFYRQKTAYHKNGYWKLPTKRKQLKVWGDITVPLKGWKSSNIWEQP
jgi:hypothetical protein